jgi:hypothetical protein
MRIWAHTWQLPFKKIVREEHSSFVNKNRRLEHASLGLRILIGPVLIVSFVVWIPVYFLYVITFRPLPSHLFNTTWFMFNTYKIILWRERAKACMSHDDHGAENKIGLGQVVVLILLISVAINSTDPLISKSSIRRL